MSKTRTTICRLDVYRRWAWVSLVPLLAGACKSRDLACENGSYFQVLQPEVGAGTAPFSIERPGPKVNDYDLEIVLNALILKSDNRVRAEWISMGHTGLAIDLMFSPAEGHARAVNDPSNVYPMRRFSDNGMERVRFGFRSRACRVPGKTGIVMCPLGDGELFLAAEMTCLPEASPTR